MQTPIVAKPTEEAKSITPKPHPVGICIFIKFIIDVTKKGYNYPIKIKIALALIIQLVWHYHYITILAKNQYILIKKEKSANSFIQIKNA